MERRARRLVRVALAGVALALLAGFASPRKPSAPPPDPAAVPKLTMACPALEASLATLPPAQQKTTLGLMHAQGHCRPFDRVRALAHLREGAERGDVDAMYAFFVTAGEQQADDPDPEHASREWDEGVQWLQKAAKAGNWRAAYVIGTVCYRFGSCGLPRDEAKARAWCKRYAALAPPEQAKLPSDCDADLPKPVPAGSTK